MKSLGVVLAALVAAGAHAATAYRVTFGTNGRPPAYNVARVVVAGDEVRADFPRVPGEVGTCDFILSHDGGRTFTAFDNELRTWFPLDASPFTPTVFLLGGPGSTARKVRWSWTATGPRQYAGTLSCTIDERIADVKVSSARTISVIIETTDSLDRIAWPGVLPFVCSAPEVDRAVAASAASMKGFPLRIALTRTQQYDRGPLITERRSMSVDEIDTNFQADPKLFQVPAGYREQKPIVGAPGVVR